MGFKDDLGGRGLPNTRATLNRSAFTRGGEKIAIRNNRTSGTPLRHANAAGPEMPGTEIETPPKRGWTAAAREKSLATRRAMALKRRQQQEP